MRRERLHEARRLGGVHARDRLVQQKQRRPGGKGHRNFEQSQLAIGKRGGEIVLARFNADELQHFLRFFD